MSRGRGISKRVRSTNTSLNSSSEVDNSESNIVNVRPKRKTTLPKHLSDYEVGNLRK